MSTEIQYFKDTVVKAEVNSSGVFEVRSACLGPFTVDYSEENLLKVINLKLSLTMLNWCPRPKEVRLVIDETESDYRINIILRDSIYDYTTSVELIDSRWRKYNFEELATIKEFAHSLKKSLKRHFEKEGVAVRSSFSWKGITY